MYVILNKTQDSGLPVDTLNFTEDFLTVQKEKEKRIFFFSEYIKTTCYFIFHAYYR